MIQACAPDRPVKHSISQHIETTGQPVFTHPRRLALGIIRPSYSSWSSPLHMVPKRTPGDWRPCGDFRTLNRATAPDLYPIPHLQDFSAALQGTTIITHIDLICEYHQILVAPEDSSKTAVTTPFGLFEFLKIPFGLSKTAQTFQRFMD